MDADSETWMKPKVMYCDSSGLASRVQSQIMDYGDAFAEICAPNCHCEGRILIFMAVQNDDCISDSQVTSTS